ncbi:MAG TPA: hypothetical protein ENI87_10135, partial [bacterium]|nr:hypothetical protein [bacterium]
VATKETRRLARLFAHLRGDDESRAYPDDYQHLLTQAIELTDGLDRAVRAHELDHAETLLSQIGKTCKQCHRSYRNR